MKKTLMALVALSGMAMAENVTIDLFSSTEGWVFNDNTAVDTTARTLTTSRHWGSPWADYTLETSITLTQNDALLLSYTLGVLQKSDVAATVALHSATDVFAVGLRTYNGGANKAPFGIGYTTEADAITSSAVCLTTPSDNKGYGFKIQDATYTDVVVEPFTDYQVKELVAWNEDQAAFVASVYVNNALIGTQTLGETYTLNKVSITLAGNTNNFVSVPVYKGMTLVTPEPATATLSLLALAGLAARRRRH